MGLMWAAAYLQMRIGTESLALRYLVTLSVGYLGYLLILRLWAAALVGRESSHFDGDLPTPNLSGGSNPDLSHADLFLKSGGGGDFSGGGASGDFSDGGLNDGLGNVVGGALDAAAGADEGIVIVVPVVAIFLIGVALLFGVGSLLLLYFGWDALLTVAVELSFSYVSARTAIRVVREGWLSAAVRLTWKPLMGAMLCAVVLGATIDYFLPNANSLPQAIKLIKSSHR